MKLDARLQERLRKLRKACQRRRAYTATLKLDEKGVKVEKEFALEMYKTFGFREGDLELTRSYVEQFKQGPHGTACGKDSGHTSKHWHRFGVLMVNLGAGEKHWTVWSVQSGGQQFEVVLKPPEVIEDGKVLSAHVLYLPPAFYHEVKSAPNSLAVHAFFMPVQLHQHLVATFWATSPGAHEKVKVLPGDYDAWKRENHILEGHVKKGGGGQKRARDGHGPAAASEASGRSDTLPAPSDHA